MRGKEEKTVEVTVGDSGRIEVDRDPRLRIVRKFGAWFRVPTLTAVPTDRSPSDPPASPIVCKGDEMGEGPLRFGLPPGAWALHLHDEQARLAGEPRRLGSILRVSVEAGKTLQIQEPAPSRGSLSIDASERALECRYLSISGVTSEHLPVEDVVPSDQGFFRITGLPRGSYRLTLIDEAESEPPLVREVEFDGEALALRWTAASGE